MENIKKLKIDDEKLRDIYLRNLAVSTVEGPLTGVLSKDKPWLKNYTEEQIINFNVPDGISIHDYMMQNSKENSDDIALYYYGSTMTFKELNSKINQFAKSVQANGIKPKEIVTICMPNTPEAVIAFYALNKIGVVANMIHPLSSENEIKSFANETNSKMLLTIDTSLDKINNILDNTNVKKTIVVSPGDSMPFPLKMALKLRGAKKSKKNHKSVERFNTFMKEGRKEKIKPYKFSKDETALLLHTGGTSGKSKAVELTNENFNAMVEQFKCNVTNFERGDKMLTVMPVFHGFGLCSSLHLPLSLGVGCILIPKLELKDLDKLFERYKPNHILGVPTLFKGILNSEKLENHDFSYLKNIVSGGDLVKNSFEERINCYFRDRNASVKLSKGYGLSEAVAGATFASNEYNSPGTVGIPMIGTNVKIVKPGTDEEVAIGEKGEICLKGPSIMKGYYNNEEETKNTIRNEWLHTGDIGSFPDGELKFSTRKGNMIISSGVNVYPNVIEEVIEEHKDVELCAVIGVPDDYKGEVAKAYIVLKESGKQNENIQNEINDMCKKNLNKYSVPKQFEYIDELPRTLLGKISHRNLKSNLESKEKTLIKK